MTEPLLRRDLQPIADACHRNPSRWETLGAIAVVAMSACSSDPKPTEPNVAVEPLFNEAFAGTNGRSCASCHVPEDNFALTPDHVARVFEVNPNDPLFAAIDADDPTDSSHFAFAKKS